jgi:hypothetical protein
MVCLPGLDNMRENIDFVAFAPQSDTSWSFYIAGKARKISEVTEEILDITKKVLDTNKGFFLPTKIEYVLTTESEDFPAYRLFSFAERLCGTKIEPLNRFPREVKSDDGISYDQLKKDVQSIENPKNVIRYIRKITMDGKTRFVLEGRDEYINGKSKGLYAIIRDDKVLDKQVGTSPLRMSIEQTTSTYERKDLEITDPAYYQIRFRTYTDIWFENTPIGLANRGTLRKVLRGIYDGFDVIGLLFMSDHFSERELKEVVFREDSDMSGDSHQSNNLAYSEHVSLVDERAAYYWGMKLDWEIMPTEDVDLRAGNKYIVVRAPVGALTKDDLKGFLDDALSIFSNSKTMRIVKNNPTKLEISARDGMKGMDTDTIKDEINKIIGSKPDNPINEIEVFLPDSVGGGSVLGKKNAETGLFDWVRTTG